MAYSIATLRTYARHKPFRARLEFPEGDHEPMDLENLLQVAVGNGRHYDGGDTEERGLRPERLRHLAGSKPGTC